MDTFEPYIATSELSLRPETGAAVLERALGGWEQALRRRLPTDILPADCLAPAVTILRQLQPEKTPPAHSTGCQLTFDAGQIRSVHGQLKRYFDYLGVRKQLTCRQRPQDLATFEASISASRGLPSSPITIDQNLDTIAAILEAAIPPLQVASERYYDNWEGIHNRDHVHQVARHWPAVTHQPCTGLTALIVYLHDLGGKAVLGQHAEQTAPNVAVADRVCETIHLPSLQRRFVTSTIGAMNLPFELVSLRSRQQMAAYQRLLPQLQQYLSDFTNQRAGADFLFSLWLADAASYTLLGGNLPAADHQFIFDLDEHDRLRSLSLTPALSAIQADIYHDLELDVPPAA